MRKVVANMSCTAILLAAPWPTVAQEVTAQGFSVWNHAYQENFDADEIAEITLQASDAYVLLDPLKEDIGDNPSGLVDTLKAANNQVAAYISIGTGEDWRRDFAELRPYLVERQWGEWVGEYFLSSPNDAVLGVMKARIDLIAGWGFDWVEFDNMDWAADQSNREIYGITASEEDATRYFRTLCSYVHNAGMRCMAKNTVAGADTFDGVTYESYQDERNWWDQEGAMQFLAAGKPVIIIHYNEPDCASQLSFYLAIYGTGISFICEDPTTKGMAVSDTTYFQTETTHFAQADDIGFAARAPPLAVTNVEVTGGATISWYEPHPNPMRYAQKLVTAVIRRRFEVA